MKYQLVFIQLYYIIISILAPKYAAKKAALLFQTIRKKDIRQREQDFYNNASHYTIPFYLEPIDVYELGQKNAKSIFLLHGWDSNAGSMYKIANTMVDQGFHVTTINLPGHANYKSNKTNFHECKEAFKALILHKNPQEPISIISHSFGSGVVSGALSELDYEIDKLIFLTSPNKMIDFFNQFKLMIKLGDKAYEHMCVWASNILGEDLKTLTISEKLLSVSYNKLLLIHDKKDKILPFSNSEEIHAINPNSQIDDHVSVGHYRMLWNSNVMISIKEFINKP